MKIIIFFQNVNSFSTKNLRNGGYFQEMQAPVVYAFQNF